MIDITRERPKNIVLRKRNAITSLCVFLFLKIEEKNKIKKYMYICALYMTIIILYILLRDAHQIDVIFI